MTQTTEQKRRERELVKAGWLHVKGWLPRKRAEEIQAEIDNAAKEREGEEK